MYPQQAHLQAASPGPLCLVVVPLKVVDLHGSTPGTQGRVWHSGLLLRVLALWEEHEVAPLLGPVVAKEGGRGAEENEELTRVHGRRVGGLHGIGFGAGVH